MRTEDAYALWMLALICFGFVAGYVVAKGEKAINQDAAKPSPVRNYTPLVSRTPRTVSARTPARSFGVDAALQLMAERRIKVAKIARL